jgi:hypothetical protein
MPSQSIRAFHSETQVMGPILASHTVRAAAAGRMKFAWEDIMLDAAEYRAMAAEHHRLAGMCRSPESRERHLRMEEELLTLAAGQECLRASPTGAIDVLASSAPRDHRATP